MRQEVLQSVTATVASLPRVVLSLNSREAIKDNVETTRRLPLPAHHFLTISLLLLMPLTFFLFFYRLGDRDLWSSHEGRAAQDAETILEDGHWGMPRLFDQKYVDLQKPPLYYWLVAGIAALRGEPVDAWAVRLPSALAALGCVMLLFWFGARRSRFPAALAGALMLATAVHFTWLARIGRIDMPLTFAISLALVCFYLGRMEKSWYWLLPAYLSLAVAVLLKGPIGLVLPGVVVAGWLLVESELPAPWRWRSWMSLAHRFGLWWGVPLILAVAGPWFFWAASQTDGALEKSLWYHNVVRAVGGTEGMRARPALFYIPRFSVDFLPWSPLVLIGVWYLFRHGRWREDSEARFGLVWLVSMVAVLSCVGFKRADYLLPAYPGAALFLGCVGERWLQTVRHPVRLTGAFGIGVISCLVGWWIHVDSTLPRGEAEREDRTFAAEIRRYAPAPDPVIFFRVEEHSLGFHIGRPLDTILEWENLDFWAGQPRPFYVVMDPDTARDWRNHLHRGSLEAVTSNVELAGGKHDHPLILLRTRPCPENCSRHVLAIP
ncbi:MAG TPA: glycosyltransferase family 39 protein [Gemmataceae bacterium]|nr:glycosyltransferase family 39 protein [Gemmataceae bacterium]